MKKLVFAILVTTSMLSNQVVGADQTKPADQCIDGICIGDDLGQLSKIKWLNSGQKTELTANDMALIKQCAESNAPQWNNKSQKMCEIIAKSILNYPPEEIINWFKENPIPVCNLNALGVRNYTGAFDTVNALGTTTVKVGFSEAGRAEVFEITKRFSAVKNEEDKKILLDKLIEKHKPYLNKDDYLNRYVKTPWGGIVQVMIDPITVKLGVWGDGSYDRTPTKGACTPVRKEISVM